MHLSFACRLIFVVIQVRGRDNQDFFAGRRYDTADPGAEGFQIFQSKRAQRDWHDLNVRLQRLQERQLHFERMFLFVRACIFDERWTRSFEFRREHRIDRNVAERRTPSSFAPNRHIRTARKMAYAENNDTTRNMNLREDGASYMSR